MTQRHEDSDDDTYVTLGKAFEKLETVEDVEKAKRKKDKEHYVTDDQGRRRFHGAFTGGFSAGYFNTVGSEEGWTPSSFVSSKGKKSEFSGQRPEDFMDSEDLGDHGIAPRAISAKEPFNQKTDAPEGVGRKRDWDSQHSVIPGIPALQNLIVPACSSVGVQLLKTMGWKEGQGVGPKMAKYTPGPVSGPRQGVKKVYGCSLPDQGEEGASSYPKEAEGFLFAPVDVTPWEAEGKDDMHGIGYRGIQDQQILGSRKTTKALYGMSGEAFGVGALEDDDGEEDDVYGTEALTSYDSTLAPEKEITMERKFGWTGGLQSGEWELSSFKKASKHTSNAKKYPPPDVPRDFVCKHKFGRPGASAPPPPAHTAMEGVATTSRKPLGSAARSQLLSDTPDSVFSLLSQTDRERLKHATEQAKGGGESSNVPMSVSKGQQPTSAQQQKGHLSTPASSSRPAISEPAKLKPFTGDPAKMARYEAFSAGKALSAMECGVTEWERQREVEEFSRVAKVFQPLATSMASKFTRGDDELAKERGEETKQPERPLTPESDAVQAAKANMFGVLTRETQDWYPRRLLCKRFNIPDPYPDSSIVGVSSARKERLRAQESSRNIDFIHTQRIVSTTSNKQQQEKENAGASASAGDQAGHVIPQSTSSQSKSVEETPSSSEQPRKEGSTAPISTQARKTTEKRPPMDLFKAIFAESSSESDSSLSDTETKEDITSLKKLNTIPPDIPSGRQWQDLSVITNTVFPPDRNHGPVSGHSPMQTENYLSSNQLTSAKTKTPVHSDERANHNNHWRRDHTHDRRDRYRDERHDNRSREGGHSRDDRSNSNEGGGYGQGRDQRRDLSHDRLSRDERWNHRNKEHHSHDSNSGGGGGGDNDGGSNDRGGVQKRDARPSCEVVEEGVKVLEVGGMDAASHSHYGPALPLELLPSTSEELVETEPKRHKHKDHHHHTHQKKKHKDHKDHKKHKHKHSRTD